MVGSREMARARERERVRERAQAQHSPRAAMVAASGMRDGMGVSIIRWWRGEELTEGSARVLVMAAVSGMRDSVSVSSRRG